MDLAIPLPMLASPGQPPSSGARFAAEFKWDGARVMARCAPDGTITLASRTLRDTTSSYPELVEALRRVADGRGLVLDGEVVAPDPTVDSAPSFSRLQRRLHVQRPSKTLIDEIRTELIVFDVVADGSSIRSWPYSERRALLDGLGLDDGDRVRVPPMWLLTDISADELLISAAAAHLEGLVCKKLDSPYEAGRRSKSWIKSVLRQSADLLILGAVPGSGAHAATFGALVLGGYDVDGRLQLAGTVGTGFTAAARRHIRAALDELRRDTSPLAGPVPVHLRRAGVWWVDAVLVAEISHREVSSAGLRHPSFRAIRTDKRPDEIGLPARTADDPH
ncbi:ATP-dependent DNA ligase [Nocardia salmonicida]|uniref:ATP-dependent DNA ligase n=1 Tax=Nocardia salmonicida TaxID=53431 RepID=UPI0037BAF8CC